VLGIGDYTVARFCDPHLSSIPQPGELIGYEALRILDNMMAGAKPASMLNLIEPPAIVSRESTQVTGLHTDPMRQVRDFIAEHACQNISVNDLMKLARMSQPTLNRQFSAAYHTTVGAEIRRIKTEQAQYYLRTTTLSMTKVAELCGYSHQAKFANFFKRETSMTPSEYRSAAS
jgi:LacI family transcriptional regulator